MKYDLRQPVTVSMFFSRRSGKVADLCCLLENVEEHEMDGGSSSFSTCCTEYCAVLLHFHKNLSVKKMQCPSFQENQDKRWFRWAATRPLLLTDWWRSLWWPCVGKPWWVCACVWTLFVHTSTRFVQYITKENMHPQESQHYYKLLLKNRLMITCCSKRLNNPFHQNAIKSPIMPFFFQIWNHNIPVKMIHFMSNFLEYK